MPFKSGQSGNPAGRPRGSTSTIIIKEALNEVFEEGENGLLKNICESAKNGDMQAATLLINRIYPALKPAQQLTPFTLVGDNPVSQAVSVLEAVAAGDLPADIGSQFIDSISKVIQIRESTELAERLERIEEAIKQNRLKGDV